MHPDGTGRHVNTALLHIGYRIMASSQSASQPHSSCPVTPVTLRRHPFLRQQRHRKEKVEKTRLREKGSHGGLGRVLKKPKGLLANIQKWNSDQGLTLTLASLHWLAKATPPRLMRSGENPDISKTVRLIFYFITRPTHRHPAREASNHTGQSMR